jgi:hypothetical protein
MDPSTPLSSIPPQTVAMLAAEDQGPKTIGLVVTFTALAFLVVCLRFYARVRFAIQIGWEDYFSAISIVSNLPGPFSMNDIGGSHGGATGFLDSLRRVPDNAGQTGLRKASDLRRFAAYDSRSTSA